MGNLIKSRTNRKDSQYGTPPGHPPIPIRNVAWATLLGDVIPFGQGVVYDSSGYTIQNPTLPNGSVRTQGITIAAAVTFTGAVTFSSTETGFAAAVILPSVAGAGTSIQVPVEQGQTFAAPVTLTAAQSGGVFLSDAAAGTKWILPAATAANIGLTYEFIVTTTVTSNSFDVEGATSADLFVAGGSVMQFKVATPTIVVYAPNGSSNYKYTSNGTTTGGIIGDRVKFICIGLNKWLVNGTQTATSTVATPFAG